MFHDDLAVAQMNGPENDDEPLAVVETSREVIEYLNRGPKLKLFDAAGFMVMNNVIVCEKGKKAEVISRMNKNFDTMVHVVGGSSSPGPKK